MRTNIPSWDENHMNAAKNAALRSKDPSTQVGAALVDEDNHCFMTGYNGFTPGSPDTPERWERPGKYDRVIHAEVNAICHAAKKGFAVGGATLYVTHFPCNKNGCARVIAACGIKRIVHGPVIHGWGEDEEKAMEIFRDAGIEVVNYQRLEVARKGWTDDQYRQVLSEFKLVPSSDGGSQVRHPPTGKSKYVSIHESCVDIRREMMTELRAEGYTPSA